MASVRAYSQFTTTIEDLYAKLKTMSGLERHRNTVLSKTEVRMLLADKDQTDAVKVKLAKAISETENLQRMLNLTQYKGVDCTTSRLKALLEQAPSCQSEFSQQFFNCIVLEETLRLALKESFAKCKRADQISIAGRRASEMPGFYNTVKPKMTKLKMGFDKELTRATKLSLWLAEKTSNRQSAAQKFTHSIKPKRTSVYEQQSSYLAAGENMAMDTLTECNSIMTDHQAVRGMQSYDTEAKLQDKLNTILTELQYLQSVQHHSLSLSPSQRSGSISPAKQLLMTYATPEQLFAHDDGDTPDVAGLGHLPITPPVGTQKRNSLSANSQDLIVLVVSKMVATQDGQWKKIFRQLMIEKCTDTRVNDEIAAIENKPRSEESQAFDALRLWCQSSGRTMNIARLREVLEGLLRNDICESISDYETRLMQGKCEQKRLCDLCQQYFLNS